MTKRDRDEPSGFDDSSDRSKQGDEQSLSGSGAASDSVSDRTQGGYGGTSGASGSRSAPPASSESSGDETDADVRERLGRGAGAGDRGTEGIGHDTPGVSDRPGSSGVDQESIESDLEAGADPSPS